MGSADPDFGPPRTDREGIQTVLVETIDWLHARIHAVDDAQLEPDERLQLERMRRLSQLVSQFRLLARDADVDEMEAELDLLADAVERQGDSR